MAVNKPIGDDARKGAVKNRSQVISPVATPICQIRPMATLESSDWNCFYP
jgi:hypothetical protein